MQIENSQVPDSRVLKANDRAVNADGSFVLYWMISARRPVWNFGLQRAVEWARHLNKPLVVFEALRAGYKWNCDRFHAFVIQGMADNAASFSKKNVAYYPYLEPSHGDADGLMKSLARESCLVVTDDFPCFFLPRMVKAVALRSDVAMESIDSNGLFPMRATERVFSRAYDFRRFLQKNLLPHLLEMPKPDPLKQVRLAKPPPGLLKKIQAKWPVAAPAEIAADPTLLKGFSIDHSVGTVEKKGGPRAAKLALKKFLTDRLEFYAESRNQPELEVSSGLSPYLHFGHISAHQVFDEATRTENWNPGRVAEKAKGSSSGWWGTSEPLESFLDELITWREVGYNMCANRDDYEQYESLPEWAQKTLGEHEKDPRQYVYPIEQFEFAKTHDSLWNAAQWQLVTTGVMHNYLRMLWGKKILEWSATPRDALKTMVHLNNKYALDGRNPNSYSGIFWVLGRYDRAWGPERPIFGKIRYMSSDNTARKVRVKNYIRQYTPESQKALF